MVGYLAAIICVLIYSCSVMYSVRIKGYVQCVDWALVFSYFWSLDFSMLKCRKMIVSRSFEDGSLFGSNKRIIILSGAVDMMMAIIVFLYFILRKLN